jgi:transcriptional regulator with XRE-family HTH domain
MGKIPSRTTADLVRAARQRAGLTQQDLAVRAGLAIRTVARIEAGEGSGEPYLSTLTAIADALGVPVIDLVGDPAQRAS